MSGVECTQPRFPGLPVARNCTRFDCVFRCVYVKPMIMCGVMVCG